MPLIYYFVFKKYLTAKNLSIDVSEDIDEDEPAYTEANGEYNSLALQVIAGLGGVSNIQVVNNCISRLRVDVNDMSLVQENLLKKTGSMGIIKPSDTHIQVVYGPKIEKIADAVRKALNT